MNYINTKPNKERVMDSVLSPFLTLPHSNLWAYPLRRRYEIFSLFKLLTTVKMTIRFLTCPYHKITLRLVRYPYVILGNLQNIPDSTLEAVYQTFNSSWSHFTNILSLDFFFVLCFLFLFICFLFCFSFGLFFCEHSL